MTTWTRALWIVALWSLPAVAQDPAPEPATEGGETPIEFVGGDQVEEATPVVEAPTDEEEPDTLPPTFDDFAVASGAGSSAPAVTAVVTDDLSGIAAVIVFYRRLDEVLFQEAKLGAGDGGLFLGRLPDGLQATGFAYYVEARDEAGNVARLGAPETPFKVAASTESALESIEREEAYVPPGPTIAPAWIALSLGVGVIASATAAIFVVDLVRLGLLLREPLQEDYRAQVTQAAIGDAAIGGILGVVAVASLATGTGLFIFSAIEGE